VYTFYTTNIHNSIFTKQKSQTRLNNTDIWQVSVSPASLGFPVLPSACGPDEIYHLK